MKNKVCNDLFIQCLQASLICMVCIFAWANCVVKAIRLRNAVSDFNGMSKIACLIELFLMSCLPAYVPLCVINAFIGRTRVPV